MTSTAEPDDQPRVEQRYDAVLRCIEYQTGGPGNDQRAGVPRPQVHLHLAVHGPYDLQGVKQSIREAIENDDVLAFDDEDGRERLARRTPEGLKMVVAEQNMREHPDVDLQERCVAILRGVDDE